MCRVTSSILANSCNNNEKLETSRGLQNTGLHNGNSISSYTSNSSHGDGSREAYDNAQGVRGGSPVFSNGDYGMKNGSNGACNAYHGSRSSDHDARNGSFVAQLTSLSSVSSRTPYASSRTPLSKNIAIDNKHTDIIDLASSPLPPSYNPTIKT